MQLRRNQMIQMTPHAESAILVLITGQRRIVMERFLERHQDRVFGVLSGFDRLVFRGTFRSISYLKGLEIFLSKQRVLSKDFAGFAMKISDRLKQHAHQVAESSGRPYIHLDSPKISKEDVARRLIKRDKITQGLVCVLGCVEPCRSFQAFKNRETKHLDIRPAQRQCLHLYFYYVDREFGLMHVRLQTWLPMTIQVCLNGREYLARQLDKAGIGYEQRDNCFARIDDLPRAQKLLDRLATRKWERVLQRFAARVNPWFQGKNALDERGYYWTVMQGEFATDVMFRDACALKSIYPALLDHAMKRFSCEDSLRFLGRRIQPSRYNGEVRTTLKRRPEGVRIKHWVEENSIKMYDKQGCVLRIETTINNPRRFKVLRPTTRNGKPCLGWLPLRKGIADIIRRVEISRAANERYLEALSVVGEPAPTSEILDPVSRRITHKGRVYRGLRPVTADECRLFQILLRGEHALQGIRNVDVRKQLYPHEENDPERRRRASGRVTRSFRLLRAHGLIRKVSTTRYYRVTIKGQTLMTTALRLRQIQMSQLAI
jgi:hypothetical protein